DRRPRRAGAWVTVEPSSLSLRPHAHARVRFTVRVPAGAPAGEWLGGIVAEATHVASGRKHKTGVRIRIRDQTIVAVQVEVPGPRRAVFALGAVTPGGSHGFQQLLVHGTNAG